MANKKDPLDDLKLDDDLKGLDTLDNEDSLFDDFDASFPDIDSESNREPVTEQTSLGDKLKAGATLVGMGVASTVASRVKDAFPETTSLASEALNVTSDFARMKYEFTKDIDPTINQIKSVSRRLSSKLATSNVIPKAVDDKIQKWFAPKESAGKDPSVDESRDFAVSDSISGIFRAQDLRNKYDRQEDRVDKYLDRKIALTSHRDLSSLLNDIRIQTLHVSSFLGGSYTGYLKKSLELKYKQFFVAQDTLELLRLHSQNTEAKLEAIRHNTALPDIQKEHTLETMRAMGKAKIIGKIQDYASELGKNIYGNIKENLMEPAKDMLGSMGDLLEGFDTIAEMEADEAELTGKKPKSLMQRVGGVAGKGVGWMLGKSAYDKIHNKFVSPYRNDIEKFFSTAKDRAIWELNAIKKGNKDGVLGEDSALQSLIDLIVPDVDTSLGKTDNLTADDPLKSATFDNATRESLVEVIPGYLSLILQQVTNMATGRENEEKVYDVHAKDFVTSSKYQATATDRLYGNKEARTRAISGSVEQVKTSFLSKAQVSERDKKAISFDKINDQIGTFVFNMAQQKELATNWPKELRRIYLNNGSLDGVSKTIKDYFRGINDIKEVSLVLSSSLLKENGEVDNSEYLKFFEQVANYSKTFQDQHRDKLERTVRGYGNTRFLQNTFSQDEFGRTHVDIDKTRNIFTNLDQKILKEGDTTKYAVSMYDAEKESKKDANKLIKIVFDPDERKKLGKYFSKVGSKLKELLRPILLRLGIPEKWLEKMMGIDPSNLSDYDEELLERLTKEGIKLEYYLELQNKAKENKFSTTRSTYKQRKTDKAAAVDKIMQEQNITHEEAKDIYRDQQRTTRVLEYGPKTTTDKVLDKSEKVLSSVVGKDKAKTITDTAKTATKHVANTYHNAVENIRNTELAKNITSMSTKIYNDAKTELNNEINNWLTKHPELAQQIENHISNTKATKTDTINYIKNLYNATNKQIKDIHTTYNDQLNKTELNKITSATNTATRYGNVLKDTINNHYVEATSVPFKTSIDDTFTTPVTGHALTPVKQVLNKATTKIIRNIQDVQKLISKTTNNYLDKNPDIKQHVNTWIKENNPTLDQVQKYINDIKNNVVNIAKETKTDFIDNRNQGKSVFESTVDTTKNIYHQHTTTPPATFDQFYVEQEKAMMPSEWTDSRKTITHHVNNVKNELNKHKIKYARYVDIYNQLKEHLTPRLTKSEKSDPIINKMLQMFTKHEQHSATTNNVVNNTSTATTAKHILHHPEQTNTINNKDIKHITTTNLLPEDIKSLNKITNNTNYDFTKSQSNNDTTTNTVSQYLHHPDKITIPSMDTLDPTKQISSDNKIVSTPHFNVSSTPIERISLNKDKPITSKAKTSLPLKIVGIGDDINKPSILSKIKHHATNVLLDETGSLNAEPLAKIFDKFLDKFPVLKDKDQTVHTSAKKPVEQISHTATPTSTTNKNKSVTDTTSEDKFISKLTKAFRQLSTPIIPSTVAATKPIISEKAKMQPYTPDVSKISKDTFDKNKLQSALENISKTTKSITTNLTTENHITKPTTIHDTLLSDTDKTDNLIKSNLDTVISLLQDQLLTLRDIELNTSESAYNGVIAAAMSSGDQSVIDKLIKRPGVARRAARKLRGTISDTKSAIKDSLLYASSKTAKLRKGVKAVGGLAKTVALSPMTVPAKAIKAAFTDFSDIFIRGDYDRPLVEKKQFINNDYPDKLGLMHEDGKPLRSMYEISGPVYERVDKSVPKKDWNEVISEEDIDRGLVTSDGKPIKTISARIGRLGKKVTKTGIHAATWGISKTVGGSISAIGKTANTALDTVGGFHGVAKTFIKPFPSVYRVDMDLSGDPLISGSDIKKYGYFKDKQGRLTKVKSSYDIDRPVYDGRDHSVMISFEDIKQGLVDPSGNPLNKFSNKLGRGVSKLTDLAKESANLIFGLHGNIVKTAWDMTKKTTNYLFKAKDPYQDVYLKGEIHPDKVKVRGTDIRDRKIFFAESGNILKSCYDIDAPVMNEDKQILLSKEDIEKGLVNVDGKSLTKQNKFTLGGKIIRALPALAKKAITTYGKALKGVYNVGKKAVKGVGDLLTGGGSLAKWGSAIVGDLRESLFNIFGDKRDHIFKQDLKTMVSDKLDNIYTLLQARLPNAPEKGDTDKNGYREGSYRDYLADKKAKANEQTAKNNKISDKKGGVGGVIGSLGSKDKASGEEGGGDSWSDDIFGGMIGDGLRKYGGKVLGKMGGLAKGGMGLLRSGGSLALRGLGTAGTALAGTGIGTAALSGLGTAGSALATGAATAGSALATGASALGGAAATGIGTAATAAGSAIGGGAAALGGLIASNPIGWAVGGASVLGAGGYLLYKWATSKSDAEASLFKSRLNLYGATDNQDKSIEKIEKRTADIFNGKKPELTPVEIEAFAKDFGCFDKSDVKGSVDYFISWYKDRFTPVFAIYLESLKRAGLTFDNQDNVSDTQSKAIGDLLTKNARANVAQVAMLVPTLAAYAKTKKDKADEDATKNDQTEASKEDAKLKAEAEKNTKEAKDKELDDQKKQAARDAKHKEKLDAIKDASDKESLAIISKDAKEGKSSIPSNIPVDENGNIDKAKAAQLSTAAKEAMHGGPSATSSLKTLPKGGVASESLRSPITTSTTTFKDELVHEKGSIADAKQRAAAIPYSTSPSPITPSSIPSKSSTTPGITPSTGKTLPGITSGATTSPKASTDATDKPSSDTVKSLSTDSYTFGKQTAKMEAGGNPGMVSSGDKWGDPGGISYGKYQFASKYGIPEKFMNSPEAGKYGQMLKEAGPVNSPAFKAKWKELGSDPGFESAQDAYGKKMYLDTNVNKKASWITKRSPMVQEAIMHAYMGSSNQGNHMINAINNSGGEKLSDKEILVLMDKEYKANIGKTKGFWAGQKKDATFLKKYDEQQRVLIAAQDQYDAKKGATTPSENKQLASNAPNQLASTDTTTTSTTPATDTKITDPLSSKTSDTDKDLTGQKFITANKDQQIKDATAKMPSPITSASLPSTSSPSTTTTTPNSVTGVTTAPMPQSMPPTPGIKPGLGASALSGKDLSAGFEKLKPQPGVDMAGLQPTMKKAIGSVNAEFMEQFHKPITVTSAFRSVAKQEELFKKLGPGKAAKPSPNAPHVRGIAVDVSSEDANKADKAGILAKYGLSRPLWPNGKGKVKPEPWHLQLTGAPADMSANTEDSAKEPPKDELDAKKDVVNENGTPASASTSSPSAASTASSDTSSTSSTARSEIAAGGAGSDNLSSATGSAASTSAGGNTGTDTMSQALSQMDNVVKGIPGVSGLSGASSIPSTGTPSNSIDSATTAPTTTTVAQTTAMPSGPGVSTSDSSSSYNLEQLKLMVTLLTNMDGSLKSMLGWDLGSKIDGIAKNNNSNSEGNTTQAGGNTSPSNESKQVTGKEPNPPADSNGRPVQRDFSPVDSVVPIGVRRNGRSSMDV